MQQFFTHSKNFAHRAIGALATACFAIMLACVFLSTSAQTGFCGFYYVSPGGTGTGTPSSPASLQTALADAASGGTILMEAGSYTFTSTINIPNNVILDGGYTAGANNNWTKGTNTLTVLTINPSVKTATVGGTGVGFYVGVEPGSNCELKDLTFLVLQAGVSGTFNSRGLSVYGIYINSQTNVKLSRCTIQTGAGSAGLTGTTPGGSGGGSAGGIGGLGSTSTGESNGGCGTAGNTGSVPAIRNWGTDAGGSGGGGCCSGAANTAGCNSSGCQAANGGAGSTGGSPSALTGQPSGAPGTTAQYYVPVDGLQGNSGDGGGGGGGGGAGAYGDCCTCTCGSYVLSGGNGGTGGSGGLGGNGGYGGGGSFAVWAYGASTGTITDCIISPGAGGVGGAGGSGQSGAAGAAGSAGLQGGGCSGGGGGNGGSGGAGGTGGTGQQGANGASIGLYNSNGASIVVSGLPLVPNDGVVTANWERGSSNSEITITKAVTDQWGSFIGTDAKFENNLTATSSSYNASSNTAVIYYPSTSTAGDKTLTLGTTNITNFIILEGNTRLVNPTSGIISTVANPACANDDITLLNTLTAGQAANIIAYEWQVSLVSNPTAILYTSSAANPGAVAPPAGGWVLGGTYQVRLRLQESCSGWSIPIWAGFTAPAAVTITANGPTTFCKYGSVKLTASTGSKYKWSNGKTTKSITVTTSGSYIVTVTNSSGCAIASDPIVVTVNALPIAKITVSHNTLCTDTNTAVLTASKAAGDTYLWSVESTKRSITVSSMGTYSVTVTDANDGCSDTAMVTVACGDIETAFKTENNGTGNGSTTAATSGDGIDVSVYPNPYSGQFHLQVLSSNTGNINVKIYDITGQLLDERKELAYGTDVILGNGYAAGVYLVQVSQGDLTRAVRVVKSE